ncbi:MAG TPA: hypothetical protein V6D22_15415 [Candidatus Obscuribacterales bacterium]
MTAANLIVDETADDFALFMARLRTLFGVTVAREHARSIHNRVMAAHTCGEINEAVDQAERHLTFCIKAFGFSDCYTRESVKMIKSLREYATVRLAS